jgi:hypothetical protein
MMNRLVFGVVLALGVGCQKVTVTPTEASVPVSGTLTYAGKPLTGVRIRGQAIEKGGPFGFPVSADGKFSGNVVPGKYAWYVDVVTEEGPGVKKAESALQKVPDKYREPDLTRVFEVKGGETLTLKVE